MKLSDPSSIDGIIIAAYEVISGPAGQPRDWDQWRALFSPAARLIPTRSVAGASGSGESGRPAPHVLDMESYIARVEPFLAEQGFYETEIARVTEQFGCIAHAWSTYESRYSPDDPKPFMRGINSFQLFYDGERWWILSLYWQSESAECPLPKEYTVSEGGRPAAVGKLKDEG